MSDFQFPRMIGLVLGCVALGCTVLASSVWAQAPTVPDASPPAVVPKPKAPEDPSKGRRDMPREDGPRVKADELKPDNKAQNDKAPGGKASGDKAKKSAAGPRLDPKKPEDRAKLLAELYGKLKTAKTKQEAKKHQGAIERLWLRSGSATVDLLMRRSTRALGQRKKELALKLLDRVVNMDPKYVEGWNRRAFLNYADKRYGDALVDLQHVLAIDPNHFKAVEGLVGLMEQFNDKAGQLEALKILVKIHPHWPKAEKMMKDLKREVEGQPL